jgi:hypothetical protein
MHTYQVPVWFNVTARNENEAWWRIRNMITSLDQDDQFMFPEYVIEDPVLSTATPYPPEE